MRYSQPKSTLKLRAAILSPLVAAFLGSAVSGCGSPETSSSEASLEQEMEQKYVSYAPTTTTNKAISAAEFPAGYDRMIFNDDFTENAFDTARWNMENNGAGGGNNEQQYYRNSPENVFIKRQTDPKNNTLVIRTLKQAYGGKAYTSGRVNTLHKFYFTYGRVDFRAKLPVARAMWPSTWMLPSDRDFDGKPWRQDCDVNNSMYIQGFYGGWPASGEIDVMELWGTNPSSVSGSLNYGTWAGPRAWVTAHYVLNGEDYSQKFHTFSIDWQPNVITFLVDDKVYSTRRPQDLAGPWRFDRPFILIMNNAMSPGIDASNAFYPQDMEVDYVRVFQKSTMPEARYYSAVGLPPVNPNPTPSPSPSTSPIVGANALISGLDSKMCVDIRGDVGVNNAAVQVAPCNGGAEQEVKQATNGELQVLGKCVSNSANILTNGNPINIWDCHQGPDQVWVVNGNSITLKAYPNKCLTYPGSTAVSGTQLVISDCTGAANQRWTRPGVVTPPPTGVKTVTTALNPNMCIDLRAANAVNGNAVQLYSCNGTNAQRVNFAATGEMQLMNLCISNSANILTNGNLINVWSCHQGPDQVWTVEGNYIKLKANPNKCLTIPNSNATNSTQLVIYDCIGGANQRWNFN